MLYNEMMSGMTDYKNIFWDKMVRSKNVDTSKYSECVIKDDMLVLPYASSQDYKKELKKESVFRNIATCVDAPKTENSVWTSTNEEIAQWAPENGEISIKDATETFSSYEIECNKLAVITKVRNEFVNDIGFNIENYLVKHFAKSFGRAEDDAFINGTGENMPTGILHETAGAQTGVTTESITFDDLIKLFMSVKGEYRKKGVWLMNDETALVLRTLKDAYGNYIWNHINDTILGKQVIISEYMPSIDSGNKPIVFGDFSYYLIVNRSPIAVKTLAELFAMHSQTGYMACEFIDAKLINPEAIKIIRIA